MESTTTGTTAELSLLLARVAHMEESAPHHCCTTCDTPPGSATPPPGLQRHTPTARSSSLPSAAIGTGGFAALQHWVNRQNTSSAQCSRTHTPIGASPAGSATPQPGANHAAHMRGGAAADHSGGVTPGSILWGDTSHILRGPLPSFDTPPRHAAQQQPPHTGAARVVGAATSPSAFAHSSHHKQQSINGFHQLLGGSKHPTGVAPVDEVVGVEPSVHSTSPSAAVSSHLNQKQQVKDAALQPGGGGMTTRSVTSSLTPVGSSTSPAAVGDGPVTMPHHHHPYDVVGASTALSNHHAADVMSSSSVARQIFSPPNHSSSTTNSSSVAPPPPFLALLQQHTLGIPTDSIKADVDGTHACRGRGGSGVGAMHGALPPNHLHLSHHHPTAATCVTPGLDTNAHPYYPPSAATPVVRVHTANTTPLGISLRMSPASGTSPSHQYAQQHAAHSLHMNNHNAPGSGFDVTPGGVQHYSQSMIGFGRLVEAAKDQSGCRMLQRCIEQMPFDSPEIEALLAELAPHLVELMADAYGNFLIQKILEFAPDATRLAITAEVAPFLAEIATTPHGTFAVQKLVESIRSDDEAAVVAAGFGPSVPLLLNDANGAHVVAKVLNSLPPHHRTFLFSGIAHHPLECCNHRQGCCTVQKCIEVATKEQFYLVQDAVVKQLLPIMGNPYGNYVVSKLLDRGVALLDPNERRAQLQVLADSVTGNSPWLTGGVPPAAATTPQAPHVSSNPQKHFLVTLCKDKYSSNVVEKLLQHSVGSPAHDTLMHTILGTETRPLEILFEGCGNYVIQSALHTAQPPSPPTSSSATGVHQDQHSFNRNLLVRLLDALLPMMPLISQQNFGKKMEGAVADAIWRLSTSVGTGSHVSQSHPTSSLMFENIPQRWLPLPPVVQGLLLQQQQQQQQYTQQGFDVSAPPYHHPIPTSVGSQIRRGPTPTGVGCDTLLLHTPASSSTPVNPSGAAGLPDPAIVFATPPRNTNRSANQHRSGGGGAQSSSGNRRR